MNRSEIPYLDAAQPGTGRLTTRLPGYMERIGSGIRFILREMEAPGLPPPEFSEHVDFVIRFLRAHKPQP